MPSINPYLAFNGNCEDAFQFYQSVFGGELMLFRFKDTPPNVAGSFPVAENEQNRVMHVSLPIGQTVLMGFDTSESGGQTAKFGDNITINYSPDSAEDARRVFEALAEGGQIVMPIDKVFWAELFGMLVDRFGIPWMVNFGEPQ